MVRSSRDMLILCWLFNMNRLIDTGQGAFICLYVKYKYIDPQHFLIHGAEM